MRYDGPASDIRTLVFNAMLDLQTPQEDGELAFETLTNAQMVTFLQSGHSATRYSDCARDIANAFSTFRKRNLALSVSKNCSLPGSCPMTRCQGSHNWLRRA